MKAGRRLLAQLAVTTAAVVAVTGCGGSSSGNTSGGEGDDTPQRGGALVAAVRSNPISLDAARCGSSGYAQCAPIYGTLLRYDFDEEQFEPALAESFDSADGTVWTLKLKEGITFTDGTPYDAEAVIFNWEREKDPAMLSGALYWLSQIKGWKVIDPLTIEITLTSPNYQFPWAMQYELGFIGSPTAIKSKGDAFATDPVGAGPFILEEWVENSELTFTRNPDYVEEGLPYADSLTQKIIPTDDQRMNALRAGEINLQNTYLNRDATILEKEGYPTKRMTLWGGTAVAFNLEDPVAGDPDLRAALLQAINAEQITSALYPGELVPEAYFRTDSPYYDEAAGLYPEFDLAGAQAAFDKYLEKTGQSSLELSFLGYSEYPIMVQVAELVQQQLSQIKGLEVELRSMAGQELNAVIREGDYQIAMANAAGRQDPAALYRTFHSKGDLNVTGYSNPVVDKALDTIRATEDEQVITENYKLVGGELSKDAPYRLFAQENDIVTVAKNVHGVNPVNLGAMSYELLWIE